MSRQHATPVLLTDHGTHALVPLPLGSGPAQISEADLQTLIHAHPACLPISEIDPLFAGPVPLCRELNTPAGPIDNVLITPSGLPVLVECKLWRNPEARRHVVGQILDYAKHLTRWTASDLQREVARQVGGDGNPILRLLAAAGHDVDEIAFNDALTHNLRHGRFLLLIVGDGIREGVEAIAEYLQTHAGLHFSLGLVELPVFVLPGGERLVVPRVLARTENIVRTVIEMPANHGLEDVAHDLDDDDDGLTVDERAHRQVGRERRRAERRGFWSEFLDGLTLDDPDQVIPHAAMTGHIVFKFPAPGGSSWLTVYRSKRSGTIGIALSGNNHSPGQTAAQMLEADADAIRRELGRDAIVTFGDGDWPQIVARRQIADFDDPVARAAAFAWLRERTNAFVNTLRPRIRAALQDLGF